MVCPDESPVCCTFVPNILQCYGVPWTTNPTIDIYTKNSAAKWRGLHRKTCRFSYYKQAKVVSSRMDALFARQQKPIQGARHATNAIKMETALMQLRSPDLDLGVLCDHDPHYLEWRKSWQNYNNIYDTSCYEL